MTIGLQRLLAARGALLPGADAGEETVRAPRVRSSVLFGGLALLTAMVVLLDIQTGEELRLVPLLVVVPALVSVFGTIRQTAGVSVLIMLVVTGSHLSTGGTRGDVLTGISFTVLACCLGIGACVLRIRHATQIARLRSAAVALQRQILRPLPILTDQVLAHGIYIPIEEDRLVGGDIYEVVQSPYGTRVIIGDVQGKGVAAIGAGFAVLGAFREAAIREPVLTGVVDALEDAVARHNVFSAQTGEAERFVTALVLGFDGSDRVETVNCGHLLPRLLHEGAAGPAPLRHTSVPLGLAELSHEGRVAERLDFPPGATLLLFTDGVTEARDASGAFYPLDARLGRWAHRAPYDVLTALDADLDAFSDGVRRDDIAALALRRAVADDPGWPGPTGHGARRAAEVFGGR
ncbi:PP2C family protein-serine/threonine phosphatase [Streptomyces sp. NPDC058195]|uniref:PP2C family protein-serine/threonine phosphatase n=1 Tax=Streptomyces sp. NPDC058195 TaxID=3346375 RepID=UPI0036E9FCD2